MPAHEEFRELCALAITGELTAEEQKRLDEHLATCLSCRKAFHQYQQTALEVIPELAKELPLPLPSSDSSWSAERAESALFRRLQNEHRADPANAPLSVPRDGHRSTGYIPSPPRWRQFGMLYAAAVLLFVSLAISAYRMGEKRGAETAANVPISNSNSSSLESNLSDATHDRQVLLSQIAERDKAISELKNQISAGARARNGERSNQGRDVPASIQQNGLGASTAVAELRDKLDVQEQQRAEQLAQASVLEARVAELTRQLQDQEDEIVHQQGMVREREDLLQQRDATISRQEELLAHDRDIRDLMTARDLYIAEVYDVAKTGETNKPYGRIFYTKGKSLLFYAYDLDQQAGLKAVNTFQAWGRRGPGREEAVNLGILYEDSVANKRWVVKSEDAKTLQQIDAVFVTVEPHGGSRQPSSKPLLFAYLRLHPNHP